MKSDPNIEKAILGVFKDNPTKLLNYKQVMARMESSADKKEVLQALDVLVKQEKLGELDRGKYHYIHLFSQVEGVIEITQRGSGFLVCDEEGTEDVYIAPRDLNKAFHGDRVLVSLYARKKGKRLEGEVVEILNRAKKTFVGTIQRSRDFSFFLPDDKKQYVDFFIANENLNGAADGDKVIVELSDWPDKAKTLLGKL